MSEGWSKYRCEKFQVWVDKLKLKAENCCFADKKCYTVLRPMYQASLKTLELNCSVTIVRDIDYKE